MKQVLFGQNGNPSGTEYVPVMGINVGVPQAENIARAPWPAAGVLRNFVIELSTAPGAGNTRTFTLRKAGVSTALTVTISGTATTGRLTGTDVSVAVGDLVALQLSSTGTPASMTWRWSLEFEGTTTGESAYTQFIATTGFNASTRYTGVFACPATLRTVAAETYNVVAAAGNLVRTLATVTTAPGAGNGITYYVNKNGVRQDGTGGTVNTACAMTGTGTSATASYTLPLAAGDVVYTEAVSSGSFTTRSWGLGVAFVATTDGQVQCCGNTLTATLSTTTTQYRAALGIETVLGTSETSFASRMLGGVTPLTLSGLRVLLTAAPGGSATRTIDLRKNAASVGPTVTVASGSTTASDTSNSATISDGDLWNIRSVATSTPAAAGLAWAFIYRDATVIVPTLTTITPNVGQVGTAVSVTLTGTGFVIGATTVAISGTGVTVGTVTVASATSLSTTFTIAGGATLGVRTVSVTTSGGTSNTVAFTVLDVPTLTTITPNLGEQGTIVAVTLTGNGYVTGVTTVAVSGAGVTVSGIVVVSATTLQANFTISGSAAVGVRTVTVSNPLGTSGTVLFTVYISGIFLTVDGVEQVTDDVGIGLLRGTLRLEENLTARTVFSFKLRDPVEIPVIEDTVILQINGVRHFAGIVTTITEAPFGDGTIVYSLTCSDWLAVADGILINDISPAGTLMDVLEWMMTRLAEFGFTIDPAQDEGPTLEATPYVFQTYTSALNALASSIDRIWRVDAHQRLRVYEGGAGPTSPVAIDNDHVFTATREITRDGHASTVWVRFGSGTATDVTITTPGSAGMVYYPPYFVGIGPNVVTVNGVTVPVLPAPGTGWRWDTVTPRPAGTVPGSGTLTTDVLLSSSDTVVYTMTVTWPSYAVASTTVGTDVYEVAIILDYPNVFDAAVALEIAAGELAKREGFPPIFQVTTVEPWFHAGEVVDIDLPLYGFTGEGLITGVRLQHVSRRADNDEPWWQFTLEVLTSSVIPRANWLDFWKAQKGTAGGGVAASGGTVTPPNPRIDVSLGGSRAGSLPLSAATHDLVNAEPAFTVPEMDLSTARIVADVRSMDPTVSVTPILVNFSTLAVAGTGTACTDSDADYTGTDQHQTVAVALSPGETYKGQAIVAGAGAATYATFCTMRLEIG